MTVSHTTSGTNRLMGRHLSGSFTVDIDSETRSGVWDMGADDAVPGTELPDPKVTRWGEVEPQ